MSMPISSIGSGIAPDLISNPNQPGGRGGEFQRLLAGAIDRVESHRRAADHSVEQFLSGESEELHGTVLATQRAELSFQMLLEVRNKVVQAYQEVMRMQI